MMDCNTLGDINQRLPQSDTIAAANGDTATTSPENKEKSDFSNMVEDKHENNAPSLDESQEAEFDSEKMEEDTPQLPWMSNFLSLTQRVQEQEMSATENLSPLDSDQIKAINSGALGQLNTSPTDLAKLKELVLKGQMDMALSKELSDHNSKKQDHKKSEERVFFKQNATALKPTADLKKIAEQKPLPLPPAGNDIIREIDSPQSGAVNKQENIHLNFNPQRRVEIMGTDNKARLETMLANPETDGSASISKLDNIEVVRTRKQAGITLLQLQLKPDNLGTVEAKLRLGKDHLRVELTTLTPQAAKILEKDQDLLIKVLEKAGFGRETRLSLSIVERNALSVQPTVASSMHTDMTSANIHHDQTSNKEERAGSDSTFFSQGDEHKHGTAQENKRNEKPVKDLNSSLSEPKKNAFRSSHRLVV